MLLSNRRQYSCGFILGLMNICIITDGNNTIGLGHVYQSKTFAHYILNNGRGKYNVVFITKSEESVNDILKSEGFSVLACENDNQIIEHLKELLPGAVIIDKLDTSPELAKTISESFNSRLAIFTCITDANQYADVTVMGAMDSHFKNTKEIINNGHTISFHGPRYLILRPEFFKAFNKKSSFTGKVLLLLGGADPANITCSSVKTLIKSEEKYHIKAIIGRAFANREELNQLIINNRSDSLIEVVENTTRVSDYMEWADVAIVSPGISFFEALKTNTPVIVFNQNQFQHDAWAEDMTTYDKEDISLLPTMMKNRDFVYPNDPRVVSMDIGNGVNELIDIILQ